MEVEWPDHHDDVTVARHRGRHQDQVERRVGHATGKTEIADRKYFPQGFQLFRILQRDPGLTAFLFCLL